MKKQKLIIFFLLSFIGGFVVLVTCAKFGLSGGIGPLNWQEIYDTLHVFLIACFFPAIFLTFGYFVSKYGKNENEKA